MVVSRTGPVRDPWMPTPGEIHSRFGSTAPPSHSDGTGIRRLPVPDPRSGSFSYSLESISSEPRYVGAAERPGAGRSGNGDGVRSPPPPKPLKGVKLGREL
ncbi:unnamed protein product [Phytophthora fragariaefolia]|uniref:Unnamed protein product n=1 Tax=Phytophthora fragariaefolia TaxID=1490495 RepID=A0A9W7D694_9STRA|nr:unnamed protein product [Phytophthora fragariaefolia]